MLKKRGKRSLAIAIAAAAAIAIAGCGSSSSSSSSGSSSKAAGAGSASNGSAKGSPIKLGLITTLGTSSFDFSQYVAANKAAVRAINAAGGVNGHPLELNVCNDQGTPNTATTCARTQLQDHIAAEVNLNSLTGGAQVQQLVDGAKIPNVMATPSISQQYTDPNDYLTTVGYIPIYWGCMPWMKATHSTKLAIGAISGLAAGTEAASGMKSAATKAGVPVAGTVAVPIPPGDFSTYIQQFKGTGADAACIAWPPNFIVPFLKSSQQLGLSKTMRPIMVLSVLTPSAIAAAGSAANGAGTISLYPPQTSKAQFPGLQQFETEMSAEQASGDSAAAPIKRDDVSIANWLLIHALANALKQGGGDVTSASGAKASLDSAKNVDMLGLSPAWTPNAPGPKQFPRLGTANSVYIGQVKKGKVVLLQHTPASLAALLK
jgi:branched-chain amino acid transport system substrate-binding protein